MNNDIELSPTASPRAPAETGESKKTRYLLSGMAVILVVNVVLIGALLVELRSAKAQATHIQTQFAPVLESVTALASLGRFLHGNVPDMINGLLQSNFQKLGTDVYQTANRVETAFDSSSDYHLQQVAKYSSLVESISARITTFNPIFKQPAVPDPDGDGGILNILTYLTSWVDLQTNATSIIALGQTCDTFAQAMLNTDWSGYYEWNQNQNYATWNANGMKATIQTIQLYCRRAGAIKATKGPVQVTLKTPPLQQ